MDGPTNDEIDAASQLREKAVRRLCAAMGWEYKLGLVWAGLRAVAMMQAVPISVDKINEISSRLEK